MKKIPSQGAGKAGVEGQNSNGLSLTNSTVLNTGEAFNIYFNK